MKTGITLPQFGSQVTRENIVRQRWQNKNDLILSGMIGSNTIEFLKYFPGVHMHPINKKQLFVIRPTDY